MLDRFKSLGGGLLGLWLLCGPLVSVFAEGKAKLEPIKVRPGDTLWSIAQKYLKDPTRWSDILDYNKLPTSDPTVALPGMTLQVPTTLIKVRFRAAKLVEAQRKVTSREAGTPQWTDVQPGKLLYHGDGLRTRAKSWARVEFYEGSVLSVDPDSMVILKAPKQAEHDIYVNQGAVHATTARVATPSALIRPKGKDAKYTARVKPDLTTEVKVYRGSADVEDIKGLKTVLVKAGQSTNIALDGLPTLPVNIPNMNVDLDANIALGNTPSPSEVRLREGTLQGPTPEVGNAEDLGAYLDNLSVGMPVAAYHVQVSRSEGFSKVDFNKVFDAYTKVDLRAMGLPNGRYWWRVAIIDLLGERGKFSSPRLIQIGAGGVVAVESSPDEVIFEVTNPGKSEEKVQSSRFRVRGRAAPNNTVKINEVKIPQDEEGNFSQQVTLVKGTNLLRIVAVDPRGNEKVINRVITYVP